MQAIIKKNIDNNFSRKAQKSWLETACQLCQEEYISGDSDQDGAYAAFTPENNCYD